MTQSVQGVQQAQHLPLVLVVQEAPSFQEDLVPLEVQLGQVVQAGQEVPKCVYIVNIIIGHNVTTEC